MSLTDQQFRKLLAKGIKERKAYERESRSANLLKEGYALAPPIREEELSPAPFEEVYDAVWAAFEREGFSPHQDEQNEFMRKIVADHGWTWEDYMQRSVEELEAHERRVAIMLGTNESKTLTESQDPIQAALDELIILLNQTSNGDYRSQIENIIRILNPDVGGTAEPYQLQPVEI